MQFDFSPEQRLLIRNQYRILDKLSEDSNGRWRRLAEAVESGFELEYDGASGELMSEATLSANACEEVRNILAMFSGVQGAWSRLSPDEQERVDEDDLAFPGFAERGELRRHLYCDYLLNEKEVFQGVTTGDLKVTGMGVEADMINRYREMLDVWTDIAPNPDADQIIRWLKAGSLHEASES